MALLVWEQYAMGNLFVKPEEETLQESKGGCVTECGVTGGKDYYDAPGVGEN